MDNTPKPIIPWIGGKRRLADKLLPLFPPHTCYVELFAGGAALFFMRPVPAQAEVLNDINGELVNLYRVVQHHLEEFVRQFKWAFTSRKIFEWHQAVKPETLTDIQRAARFYYLQHHAFGGRVASQTFGVDTTSHPPINLCRIEESLSAAHMRLTNATVENLAWDVCMERYDRDYTFFYADPPYWQTEGYGVSFGFEQYERLADMMRRMKGKVMVSINDHPDIRRCFSGFALHETGLRYSVGSSDSRAPVRGELVITNWDAAKAGGLF